MKKLFLLLLCVPLIFSCGDKKENEKGNKSEGTESKNKRMITDLLEMNIKGKVKSIKSLSSENNIVNYYFNEFGNIIKSTQKKEGYNYITKNFFDNNERISQYFYKEIDSMPENDIIDSILVYTFKYNNGFLIESREEVEKETTKYEYDIDGNQIKSSSYNPEGLLFQETISEWNNIGQIIKSELFSITYISKSEDDLILVYTWVYNYYDNGHLKSVDFKGWKGERSTTNYDYDYDLNGNWVKRTNKEITSLLYYGVDSPAAIPDTSISVDERIISYY